ncbi:MAG: arylsulfatase [Cyclobacteriaceae bacterium]|nr:arylsulfatase [Cyclobacteriaceae bacterium]
MNTLKKCYVWFAWLLVALMGFSCNAKKEDAIPLKPNIIYIMVDDLGYGDLSCYGQQRFQTPSIDAMAREGIMFTQHYAGATVCAPSRASLMTGMHTGRTGIRGNREIKPEGQHPLEEGALTVAEALKEAGYTTGMFGKWGLGGPESEGHPNKQGFDDFYGYLCQRQAHYFFPTHLWKNDKKVEFPENYEENVTYSHDLIVAEALQFIEQNKDNPFFLYLPITIPHAEMVIPEQYMEPFKDAFDETPYVGGPRHQRYDSQEKPRAAFAAMVTKMDHDIGMLIETLKKLNIDEKTIVFFTSDNGPHREGGHDPEFFNSNGGLRGFKRDLYEGGIRVPFIARWPGVIEPGSITFHNSAFWDFLPTACELAGVEAPKDIDGISYLPEMLGKPQKEHPYLYWEFHEQGGKQAVRMEDWKGVRLNVKTEKDAPIELYELQVDDAETNNIAGQHPEIVEKIRKIMEEAHKPDSNWPFLPD